MVDLNSVNDPFTKLCITVYGDVYKENCIDIQQDKLKKKHV